MTDEVKGKGKIKLADLILSHAKAIEERAKAMLKEKEKFTHEDFLVMADAYTREVFALGKKNA
jgi:hypothetical protein